MKFLSARGALLGALCLGAAIGQAVQHQPSSPPPWPPDPVDMVYVDWRTQGGGVPAPLPGDSSLVAYEVPSDKWFVLTGHYQLGLFGPEMSVVEEVDGNQAVKVDGYFANSMNVYAPELYPLPRSPLGIAFRPGSRVLIGSSEQGAVPANLRYAVAGYLVDSTRTSPGTWPPHPRGMVTIASESFPDYQPGSGIRITSGEEFVIYSVPSNKTFVLTGCRLHGSALILAEQGPVSTTVKLHRDSLDNMFGPPVGVVFDPGTKVVVITEAPSADIRFGLSGYLADA